MMMIIIITTTITTTTTIKTIKKNQNWTEIGLAKN